MLRRMLKLIPLLQISLLAHVLSFAKAYATRTTVADCAHTPQRTPVSCSCAEGNYTATIKLLVTPDGVPTKMKVKRSAGNACLDAKAIEAVKSYKFPARPVAIDVVLDVNFACDRSGLK